MQHKVTDVVYRRFNEQCKSKQNLWNANPPNSAKRWNFDKKPVVQTLRVSEYRCQSVSITAENDFVLATSTFSQVPVAVPAVQVPVQVPVLGMQVQVPVPENCT